MRSMTTLQKLIALILTVLMTGCMITPGAAEAFDYVNVKEPATEATGETEPMPIDTDPRSMLESITATAPEDADNPITHLEMPQSVYFKDFTYSEDIVLSGIYETNKHFFQIPKYWDCTYAYAQLEVELSQLIQDVPASLTFMVNGIPITSYKMDYRNGKTQIFFVEIPLKYIEEGYNSFDITGYVRIYDDEGCIDDFSGANWISIRRTSFIQVGYNTLPHGNCISNYPYPFISSIDESGTTTSVFVSDKCAPEELSAALLLRAGLGSKTALEDAITLARLSDRTGTEEHCIVVSLLDNLDARYYELAKQSMGGTDLSNQAMVTFVMDGNCSTLIITSKNGECLNEAAMMLSDESRVTQEKASVAFVREDSSASIRSQIGTRLEAGRLTLDALLDSGLSFVGPFHQEGDIYLPFSGGYILADSGTVSLKFRYSENLDFDRSVITVFWGDIPIGSKKLTKELAGGDELSFTMPEDVIGTYAGKITIAFDLELPDLFCTPRMDEMPWAYVTSDSSFYLPVGTNGNYTFTQRPYPFELSSRFNNLNIVIPENISAAELDMLGRLITLYGESPSPYGNLKVTYADSMTQESKMDNLIVVGTYTNNSLLRELKNKLPFQYSDTGTSFHSNDVLVLSDIYAKEISTMQLLNSPYSENRAILVVGALNNQGMLNLRDFLTSSKNIWKLEKNTVLIDSEQSVRSFMLGENQVDVSTPILKRMMETNREAAIFTVVATAVMLLFLLAAILILIRIYWRQKNKPL